MKKRFKNGICTLLLASFISSPVFASEFLIADGVDLLADVPSVVESYEDELGRIQSRSSRDFNSTSLSTGIYVGGGTWFNLNRNGYAQYTNINKSSTTTTGFINLSYKILNSRGQVINGTSIQGNRTGASANVSSSQAANSSVQAYIANSNLVTARTSGTFNW